MAQNDRKTVYKAVNLTLGYPNKTVLTGVDFDLRSGELTALLGANGSGKSTLIKTLCGFIKPLDGTLLLDGKSVNSFSKRVLSQKIGVVLTEKNSEGGLRVSEMVGLGRYPYTGFFGRLTTEDMYVVEDSLAKIGIESMRDRYVSELSDGERQKVMIAKSLAQECPVIILDEPTAYLDLKSKVEITSLLHSLAVRENKCILMSTHDLELALQLSDKLWLISKDKPFEYGATEDLILRGALNGIFGDNNSVEFDSSVGMFKSVKSSTYKVEIEGDPESIFWINNALLRGGYMPSKERCKLKVSVKNKGEYILTVDSHPSKVYNSVEQLICEINDVLPIF